MSASNNTISASNNSFVIFSETKELNFTWIIPDFNAWFSQIKKWSISPRCPSYASSNTTQWALKFRRESKYDKSFCSLYLDFEAGPKPVVKAKYELTMMDAKEMILMNRNSENVFRLSRIVRSRGHPNFIKRDFLLEKMQGGNKLTISCKIIVKTNQGGDCNETTIEKRCITADLATLLESEKFGDVSIKIENRTIPVHKTILAARSSVFAAMFASLMQERITNEVTITDIKSNVFDAMLHYIYTDKVDNLDTLSFELYAAADKYDLQGLMLLCRMFIMANLSAETVTETLICGDLHKDNEMKSRALLFLSENSRAAVGLTKTAGWQQLLATHPHLVTEAFEALANKVEAVTKK